ncbi:MAG: hypothetical protein ACI9XO_001713 [Paraglaciecola sp.]|jgi:hypothetical protein
MGELIYEQGGYDLKWDGNVNSNAAPTDTYIYRYKCLDELMNEIDVMSVDMTLNR